MDDKLEKIKQLTERIEMIEIKIKENQIELLKINSDYRKLLSEIENETRKSNYDFKK